MLKIRFLGRFKNIFSLFNSSTSGLSGKAIVVTSMNILVSRLPVNIFQMLEINIQECLVYRNGSMERLGC